MNAPVSDAGACIECGRAWDGVERGWQRYRVDLDETALYCPDCAARKFGDLIR